MGPAIHRGKSRESMAIEETQAHLYLVDSPLLIWLFMRAVNPLV
jgi:hypothetical protein